MLKQNLKFPPLPNTELALIPPKPKIRVQTKPQKLRKKLREVSEKVPQKITKENHPKSPMEFIPILREFLNTSNATKKITFTVKKQNPRHHKVTQKLNGTIGILFT